MSIPLRILPYSEAGDTWHLLPSMQGTGSLNTEWQVLPFSNKVAATPE